MMDALREERFGRDDTGHSAVTQFAYRIVSQLARNSGIETGKPERELLRLLVRLGRTGDPAVMGRILTEMKRQRISGEQVIDIYLPATVAEIGASWHDGEMDVLHATIACARLQNLLRELSRAWFADRNGCNSGARVLLAMPRDEVHTLGVMIAAHQIRRLGVSARVELVPTAAHIATILAAQRFNAVFLSVSNVDSLESSRELVKTARSAAGAGVPVVIGGGLAFPDRVGHTTDSIVAMTGADMVTGDVAAALTALGLVGLARAAE